jgi:hypothetical protein
MRNKVAKLLRKVVYGPEGSSKQRSYARMKAGKGAKSGSTGGTIVCSGPRQAYLQAKNVYKSFPAPIRSFEMKRMRERVSAHVEVKS